MTDIETVGQGLAEIIKKQDAEYVEVRLEESDASHLTLRRRELESVGRAADAGGNVRAMVKGGWGFVSFNRFDELPEKVALAVEQARLVGGGDSVLTPLPPVVDRVAGGVRENPVSLPLAAKKQLCDEYNEVIWATPKIQTSTIGYADGYKKVVFLNSEGSFIVQERADITVRVAVVAAQDGDVQQTGLSMGSRGDFNSVKSLHGEVRRLAEHAVALLAAPHVAGGEYTVVLDPVLAGVFVHEAFGHLSESDFIYENARMQEIMTLGKQFGGKHLNIVDSAALPGLRGSFKYDDEGVRATKTDLIREGRLVGRLHSRETAARMKESPTGNARAINYRYAPLVRMTNTYIEPGQCSFEEMIADIKEGIYARNWYGGTTSMEMFTFSSGEAYMIRDGKVAEALRPVVLTGNVFATLQNIDAIGNDLGMNEGGGCGKGEQMPLPVSNGSPHIRIQKCLVGGR